MICRVQISKKAIKQLAKVPKHIAVNLMSWIDDVEDRGLESARRTPGYHDEPLKGWRRHQRSIRLSRSYRAIYEITREGTVEIVFVSEVSKHDY